jgi:ribosomal protein L25 (general stress protein Ctc)
MYHKEEGLQGQTNLQNHSLKWVDLQRVQLREELHHRNLKVVFLLTQSQQVKVDQLQRLWFKNLLLHADSPLIIREFQLILHNLSA